LSAKPKILMIREPNSQAVESLPELEALYDVVAVPTAARGMVRLAKERFDGIYISSELLGKFGDLGRLLQNERILEGMLDGVMLLDSTNTILWANERMKVWTGRTHLSGENFYNVLNGPDILGPDYCPFHTALATGKPSNANLRTRDNRYYQMYASPILDGDFAQRHLIVTVHDITDERVYQQKLAAIHSAGMQLADLKPDELTQMSVEERIEYLKSNITQFTKDLLDYDVVEIRLLDRKTGVLEPLLAVGMTSDAQQRKLFASTENNGVTGFVAATGKSYLCDNTSEDPLYLEGCEGAKSSLTVPLMLADEVIGTFNVESPDHHAFSESDRQFLEIFSRDVAAAINTLFLLEAEKANTTVENVETIHTAVALPIDIILNEAVNLMERYIGHEPEVVERLQKILRNARDIKQVIHKVGQTLNPIQALPIAKQSEKRPVLIDRQILVVDADDSVRTAAHALLEKYGCVVETAHDGSEAVCMVRNKMTMEDGYDVIICDIRLPDINGYEFMMKLKEIMDPVPLVLMTGFGYDPGHAITKARQAGLPSYAALCKPFRLDQLLSVAEKVITSQPKTHTTA
jgi:two-component system, sensor histidine kinase SagS